MKNTANLVVIDSVWGHMGADTSTRHPLSICDRFVSLAGGGSNVIDDGFVQLEVKKFLEEA